MSDLKDFPYPLNTPIRTEEEIEKVVPVINEATKKISFEKEKEKVEVTTTYHYSKPERLSCKKGNHQWYMKDKKRWIASCPNCMKNLFLSPLTQTIKDGKIISRETEEIIE